MHFNTLVTQKMVVQVHEWKKIITIINNQQHTGLWGGHDPDGPSSFRMSGVQRAKTFVRGGEGSTSSGGLGSCVVVILSVIESFLHLD